MPRPLCVASYVAECANANTTCYMPDPAGLKDTGDSIDVIFYRRHTKYAPDKGYTDPLPEVESLPSPKPSKQLNNKDTLTFSHHGKYFRRASKCGESVYCHCTSCYARQLEDKRLEMQQFLVQAGRGSERLSIQFNAKEVSNA